MIELKSLCKSFEGKDVLKNGIDEMYSRSADT